MCYRESEVAADPGPQASAMVSRAGETPSSHAGELGAMWEIKHL